MPTPDPVTLSSAQLNALRNAVQAYDAAALLIRDAQSMLDLHDVDTHSATDHVLVQINNAARALHAQLRYMPAAIHTERVSA